MTNAERWHAPRLSLHESLLEFPERRLQNGPGASKEPLFKWDLDITRTSTEELVRAADPLTQCKLRANFDFCIEACVTVAMHRNMCDYCNALKHV